MKRKILYNLIVICFICISCEKTPDAITDKWSISEVSYAYNWAGISVADKLTAYIFGSVLKERYGNDIILNKVIKTINGGETWTSIYDDQDNVWHNIHFINTNEGFIKGYSLLYTTRDGGQSWSIKDFGAADFENIYQITKSHLVGYGAGGIYETYNAGETWIYNEDLSNNFDNVKSIDFIDSLSGYMCSRQGIIKTTNGGVSWTLHSSSPDSGSFVQVDFLDRSNAIALQAIYNESFYYPPEMYFNTSQDGGKSWYKMNLKTSNIHLEEESCILFENLTNIYLGARDGIYSTSDFGDSWKIECTGSNIRDIKKINNHIIAVGSGGRILIK